MKVLKWFVENYPELIQEMKDCSHNISATELSPHHAEGSVYTHVMMVYSHIPANSSYALKLSVLLHDIGKPYCQKINLEEGKISFRGHEHYSAFKAIDILNKFEVDFKTKLNKKYILYVINYHNLLHKIVSVDNNGTPYIEEENKSKLNKMFEKELDLYQLLLDMSYADMKGRIAEDNEINLEKYKLLYNFYPYKGTKDYVNKDLKAYFIIGLPGCGKTTKAEELLKEDPTLKYLSIDEEIMDINKYSFDYNGAWGVKRQKEATANILSKMKEYVDNKQSFIIDAGNFSEKIRWRRLNHISNKFEKIAYLMLSGESFVEKEMKNRKDKNVPFENIRGMAKDFSYPSLSEFDKIYTQIIK